MKNSLGLLCAAIISCFPTAAFAEKASEKVNVLFIAVDDLRPQVGCYGDKLAKTPHLDNLAARSLVFDRAYCQQAVCSPSRTSLMTGLRPDTTRVYDLETHFRLHLPDAVTLPQYFKQNGYFTQSHGKIYHGGLDDPQSWSEKSYFPKLDDPRTTSSPPTTRRRAAGRNRSDQTTATTQQDLIDHKTGTVLKRRRPQNVRKGASWESPDVPDNRLPDGKIADQAIETLQKVKDKPFFLAVGFLKPHLPFVAPKKYYDLFPPDQIPLASNPFRPKNVPQIALTDSGELRSYSDIPKKGDIPEEKARELVRGYYAAVSYMDAQLGRVLAELDRLGLREKTIIVLWGDHGWQLGEHALWCKHTNFEIAARTPFLISKPGAKASRISALVEFVDIYPTLVEMCGMPKSPALEGTSLVPLIENPNQSWKKAAFSQYPRSGGRIMGYSMRTDGHRYTEWQNTDNGEVTAVELYDHGKDPDENDNVALKLENAELTATLSKQLKAGWRAALPPKTSGKM